MDDQRADREGRASVKNQGMKSLTETFSRWQLVVLFVMVVAFYQPLSERALGMLGVKPTFIASILADAFAAGAIAWVTTFVMLHLTPKPHVEPPKKNQIPRTNLPAQ